MGTTTRVIAFFVLLILSVALVWWIARLFITPVSKPPRSNQSLAKRAASGTVIVLSAVLGFAAIGFIALAMLLGSDSEKFTPTETLITTIVLSTALVLGIYRMLQRNSRH